MAKVAKLDATKKAKLKQNVLDELSKKSRNARLATKQSPGRKVVVNLMAPQATLPKLKRAPRKAVIPLSTPAQRRSTPTITTPRAIKRTVTPSRLLSTPPPKLTLTTSQLPKAITGGNTSKIAPARFLLTVCIVGSIIIALGIIDVIGLYRWQWSDPVSHTVARTLRLPAGNVNGESISLADYLSDQKILGSAMREDREGLRTQFVSDDNSLFTRRAAHMLIAQELQQRHRPVTSSDVDAHLERLRQQTGSDTALAAAIAEGYAMSVAQFRTQIIGPLLARERLQELLITSDNVDLNQDARVQAQTVLDLARTPGADFALLSSQYNQDEASINTGGNLGWITRGTSGIPPAMEDALFTTPVGSVYPELVKSPAGYHIIKVETKATNPDDGRESLQARHILIRVDVDLYIKELLEQAQIKKYVK